MEIEAFVPASAEAWECLDSLSLEGTGRELDSILREKLAHMIISLAARRLLDQKIVQPTDEKSWSEVKQASRDLISYYMDIIRESRHFDSETQRVWHSNKNVHPIQIFDSASIQTLLLPQNNVDDPDYEIKHAILSTKEFEYHIQQTFAPALAPLAIPAAMTAAFAILQAYNVYIAGKQADHNQSSSQNPDAAPPLGLIPGAGFVDPNMYKKHLETTQPSGETASHKDLLEARKQDIEQAKPPNLTEEDIQTLLGKGRAPYKDTDRTQAGRAIDKHGMRPGSVFPAPKGSAEDINRQGIEEIDKILRHPDVKVQPNSKGGKDYVLPDGKGFRIDGSGEFDALLEPE